MFGKRGSMTEPGTARSGGEKLACSFCGKSKDDVRKLIAGPNVFICDECVQVCVDILADDARIQRATAEQVEAVSEGSPMASPSAKCTLCRLPVLVADALNVENRGLLCRGCVAAVQAAAAQATEAQQAPDMER
jgi:hypothetical protein